MKVNSGSLEVSKWSGIKRKIKKYVTNQYLLI